MYTVDCSALELPNSKTTILIARYIIRAKLKGEIIFSVVISATSDSTNEEF